MPLTSLLVLSFSDAAWNLLMAGVFTLFGLMIFLLSYYAFEKLAPFDLRKELIEDNNVAVGAMVAGMFVGIGLIIAAAIGG